MIYPRILPVLAALLLWLASAAAHNIQLKAHSTECFHEELHKDDKMTVTFQVGDREFGGSGNLDIDFYVLPSNYSYFRCIDSMFTDRTTFRWPRNRPENSVIRRLLLLSSAGWEIRILLQQRTLVCK